ncbi:CrcB family protein [Leuconostocaceae bacterium ESL0723]|nr:CrcB family protein [Leuconostocaceae bacterium ESL0723]
MTNFLLATVGAGIGAALRYLMTVIWPLRSRQFTAIFIVNVVGALIMGYFSQQVMTNAAFTFWGVGVLGGLTTFSTMMTQSRQQNGLGGQLGYLFLQVGFGLVAFALGMILGTRFGL